MHTKRCMWGSRSLVLCLGAVLGSVAGLVVAPFALLGAACALASLVLACVHVHETRRRVI
jgi:hypothetical protein